MPAAVARALPPPVAPAVSAPPAWGRAPRTVQRLSGTQRDLYQLLALVAAVRTAERPLVGGGGSRSEARRGDDDFLSGDARRACAPRSHPCVRSRRPRTLGSDPLLFLSVPPLWRSLLSPCATASQEGGESPLPVGDDEEATATEQFMAVVDQAARAKEAGAPKYAQKA